MNSLKLDKSQQRVVDYPGSCVVVAGPGSGKTRTLTAKAEQLYSSDEDLICLTFTRSAAGEMRDRMPGIPAQTIHSFCYSQVGWTGGYDRILVDTISWPSKSKYKWVLVDEVQDLTPKQLEVILSIAKDKIFAVGDPYQSIYGFNDALGKIAISDLEDFGCKRFYLRNNYRSSSEIVGLLNSIYDRHLVSRGIRHNELTAILTRTNVDLREVADSLKSQGVGCTLTFGANELRKREDEFCGSDKLRLMTCHCSKGLEFDSVILYKWRPRRYDDGIEEVNLLYVAVARASENFYFVGELPQLLDLLEERGSGTNEYRLISRGGG